LPRARGAAAEAVCRLLVGAASEAVWRLLVGAAVEPVCPSASAAADAAERVVPMRGVRRRAGGPWRAAPNRARASVRASTPEEGCDDFDRCEPRNRTRPAAAVASQL